MNQIVRIPDISVFFVLLNNGDTHYFTVKKKDEIFEIYRHEDSLAIQGAHSIEFTKNDFSLKNSAGETIHRLNDCNKNKSQSSLTSSIEIEMLYIDPELREELLARGQITYDEDASRIPGILYEPIKESTSENQKEQSSKGFSRVRRP